MEFNNEGVNTCHSKPETSVHCFILNIQLRDVLSDIEYLRDKDDHYFLRWLRARKFNVPQSEDMLRKVSMSPY